MASSDQDLYPHYSYDILSTEGCMCFCYSITLSGGLALEGVVTLPQYRLTGRARLLGYGNLKCVCVWGGRERFRFGKTEYFTSVFPQGWSHVLEPLEGLSLCALPSLSI